MTNEQMFEKLMNEMKLMQTQLTETNQLVHSISHRQENTDAKLSELTSNVIKIHDIVSDLARSQERQEKILERLSLRSIEQEQDIAELRRIK